MLDWQDFDAVFQPKTDYALDNRTTESIIKHRKEFGDQLFFDRIWKLIGLSRREIVLSRSAKNITDTFQRQGITTLHGRIKISATSG